METSITHLIWWSNCSEEAKKVILEEVFPEFTLDMEKLTQNNIHHIWKKQQELPYYIY